MPVTVKFDNTTQCPQQAQIIPDATEFNDGVMTKAQVKKLNGLSPAVSDTLALVGLDGTIQPPLAAEVSNVGTATLNLDVPDGMNRLALRQNGPVKLQISDTEPNLSAGSLVVTDGGSVVVPDADGLYHVVAGHMLVVVASVLNVFTAGVGSAASSRWAVVFTYRFTSV